MPPAAAGYSAGEHNCGGVISTGRRSGTKGRGGAGKTTTVPSSNDGCDLDTIESNMCHACARPPAPTHAAGTPKSTSPLPGDHTVCFFARISRGTTRGESASVASKSSEPKNREQVVAVPLTRVRGYAAPWRAAGQGSVRVQGGPGLRRAARARVCQQCTHKSSSPPFRSFCSFHTRK